MKAEEFNAVLNKLSSVIDNMSSRSFNSEAAVRDFHTLRDVLYELDKRRLEMEAAERGEPMANSPGPEARLDAIEKRLGEIARAVDTVALGYAAHLDKQHGIEVHLTLLAVPGYEAACVPPASG